MIRATALLTWMKAVIEGMLAALTVAPVNPLFDDVTVRLYTNDKNPTPNDVLGDYTETTFTGYAPVELTLSAVAVNTGTNIQSRVANATFISSADGQNVTIVGYYLTDAGETVLYGAERFAQSVPIANDDDFLTLNLLLPLIMRQSPT